MLPATITPSFFAGIVAEAPAVAKVLERAAGALNTSTFAAVRFATEPVTVQFGGQSLTSLAMSKASLWEVLVPAGGNVVGTEATSVLPGPDAADVGPIVRFENVAMPFEPVGVAPPPVTVPPAG